MTQGQTHGQKPVQKQQGPDEPKEPEPRPEPAPPEPETATPTAIVWEL
jgi:hypothetical protein